jgi:hypothetical protein
MKEKVNDKFSNLQIAGMESLPLRPLTEEEDKAIIQKINNSWSCSRILRMSKTRILDRPT